MADREERAKEANRDDHASRSRQWATVGSDDDDAGDGSASRKKKRSRDASDDGSDGSDSDDSSDDDDSDGDGSGGSDKKKRSKHSKSKHKSKKHKKEKHKKEKHKKHKKEKKSKRDRRDKDSSSSSSSGSGAINQNEFGKYGIIREENFFAKQREFEAYMTEVKGMPGVMGQSKREVMECFRGFMEDYNTATMPHLKVCFPPARIHGTALSP
jgi:hypothetical protein